MTGYFILIALCVLGAHAIPKPRVGGNRFAVNAPFTCMILVHRRDLEGSGTAALGSGSIISERHALTAAHLVQGDNINYQIGFVVGAVAGVGGTRRMVNANFRLLHESFDPTDFSNDIALVFLQGTATFPRAQAIIISNVPDKPTVGTALVASGFGFTAADSTGPPTQAFEADQTVADPCEFENFNLTDTHFCATDPNTATWMCPGDNGGPAISGTGPEDNRLVGVVSRVLTGCNAAQNTGYTIVGMYVDWITNVTGIPVPTFIQNYNQLHNL